jgi:SAM-dependent methyltransferase
MNSSTSDIEQWNRIADKYAQMIGTADDRIYPLMKATLWDSLGDLRDSSILDLGCGHGWLTQAMLEAGGTVLGIDGSAELLAKARQRCPQTEFIEWDLTHGLPILERRYDRIVAHMVLMDIPEINPLLKSVHDSLADAGKFIFTLPHPCFFNHKSVSDPATGQMTCRVSGYLQPEVWQIDNFGGHQHYHRSLTDYFDCLRANRLVVTRLYEPPQIPYTAANDDFRQKIPKFMLIEAMPL